jgi:DnaJ-class molecular chaperone
MRLIDHGIADLERRLKDARKRAAQRPVCQGCDGKGRFIDTTYDRTGVDVECEACFGTGLTRDEIKAIIVKHTTLKHGAT